MPFAGAPSGAGRTAGAGIAPWEVLLLALARKEAFLPGDGNYRALCAQQSFVCLRAGGRAIAPGQRVPGVAEADRECIVLACAVEVREPEGTVFSETLRIMAG